MAPVLTHPVNPWKVSTLLLTGALVLVIGKQSIPVADAAVGPKHLKAALSALLASEDHLEKAKDPPAREHPKARAAVKLAIAAVENDIKAYEDSLHSKSSKDKDHEGDKEKSKANSKDSSGAKKSGSSSSETE